MPKKQDENSPRRPIHRPVVGDLQTIRPHRQTTRLLAYASCGGEGHSPGEMSAQTNPMKGNRRAVAQKMMDQQMQGRLLVAKDLESLVM